jgi:hypothetical protein
MTFLKNAPTQDNSRSERGCLKVCYIKIIFYFYFLNIIFYTSTSKQPKKLKKLNKNNFQIKKDKD